MKTRIIQNEPDQPANGSSDRRADASTRRNAPATCAARMGRWSASHKKTAIFAWFAFVVAAFMIGNVVGTKQLDPKKSGSGESGHVDSVLADEFKQPQGDTVLIQSTTQDGRRSRVQSGDRRRRPDRSQPEAGQEGQVAVCSRATTIRSRRTVTRRSSRSSCGRPT